MSVTLLAWLVLFSALSAMAFVRPAWGVSLYLLTTFLCPPFWWWGGPIAGYRWTLYSGWIFLVAVLCSMGSFGARDPRESRRVGWFALAMLANAVLVHLLLADNWDISFRPLQLMAKFVLLMFLISASVRREADLRIVLWSLLLGAAYIGYEVTINDRGKIVSGRLEGIGMPSANSANDLASLMVTLLPLTGPLFVAGRPWERLLVCPIAPLIVNVLLLCNSRGAFLACITTAVTFLLTAPSGVRRQCYLVVALGIVATWMLMGDPRIMERFMTTFADPEQRDQSAAGRLDYWKAGLRMLADHPLGSGGDGFHDVHGPKYIKAIADVDFTARSVHNGFINEACDWGIQGFALKMAFLGSGLALAWRTSRRCAAAGLDLYGMLGVSVFSGTVGFLITCLFGDFLDNEWGYWMAACSIGYARIASQKLAALEDSVPITAGIAEVTELNETFVRSKGGWRRPVAIHRQGIR